MYTLLISVLVFLVVVALLSIFIPFVVVAAALVPAFSSGVPIPFVLVVVLAGLRKGLLVRTRNLTLHLGQLQHFAAGLELVPAQVALRPLHVPGPFVDAFGTCTVIIKGVTIITRKALKLGPVSRIQLQAFLPVVAGSI